MVGMEHRCGARHEVDFAVYARSHAGVVSSVGWLRDVSASGGYLLTTLALQPLSRISLRLVLPDGNLGPHMEGHVVRLTSDGLAVEWTEYEPELVRELVDLACRGHASAAAVELRYG